MATKPIKAAEAKALADKVRSRDGDITHLLDRAYSMIRAAAKRGRRQIDDPLDGLRCEVTADQRRRVSEQLVKDGYGVNVNGSVFW